MRVFLFLIRNYREGFSKYSDFIRNRLKTNTFAMSDCKSNLVTVQNWGSANGRDVEKYTLKNEAGQEVDIITYGATITNIKTPDKYGNVEDILLGFDNISGYLSSDNPYFGATVGRVANRIAKGRFVLDGKVYKLSRNNGENSLHGGTKGWSFKIWNATIDNDAVVMTLLSEDGDEGYPGAVIASAKFRLSNDGRLCIEMKSFASKPTPINLTNHAYFNLAGHGTNAKELYNHRIVLNADRWTVTDSNSIPTGEIRSVKNSIMDLRRPTVLGDVIDKVPGGGYDYNFCLPEKTDNTNMNQFVAEVEHTSSGRYMTVHSNQPGVQFYTANSLPAFNTTGISGKDGKHYFRHGALCLETQNYPDAVNHANFPNSILRPAQLYLHTVCYKFGVKK
ncbi:galactose mutarotase isoform X1 [Vespa crabro]|uniref:galactose mutarotase isoform X1 n=2 Tax=Vespa crabro TaxID=7445 RepID=UPI001F0213BA|nr:galactose mutarotase isoform X1 [Vespa crabro]